MAAEVSDSSENWVEYGALKSQIIAGEYKAEEDYVSSIRAGDLMGASVALHGQALERSQLGDHPVAAMLANTAIYYANLALDLRGDNGMVQLPTFAIRKIDAAKSSCYVNYSRVEANTEAVDAMKQVDSYIQPLQMTHDARKSVMFQYLDRRLLIELHTYELGVCAQIVQGCLGAMNPTGYERLQALQKSVSATKKVKGLMISNYNSLSKQLELVRFTKALVDNFNAADVEIKDMLSARYISYWELANMAGMFHPAKSPEGDTVCEIIESLREIEVERDELGIIDERNWSSDIESERLKKYPQKAN